MQSTQDRDKLTKRLCFEVRLWLHGIAERCILRSFQALLHCMAGTVQLELLPAFCRTVHDVLDVIGIRRSSLIIATVLLLTLSCCLMITGLGINALSSSVLLAWPDIFSLRPDGDAENAVCLLYRLQLQLRYHCSWLLL